MPILDWIDDKALNDAVMHMLLKAHQAKHNVKNFGKNVIDPFAALFEISGFEMGYDDWSKSERTRQAQKTLQNHVGDFHQTILGSVDGWENLKTGSVMDLISHKSKIIAEVKNKYNTISGGKLAGLYSDMDNLVMPKASKYKGYTAYYVVIIPKKPERSDVVFTPSDKGKGAKCAANEKIRIIDGASFYELVTGNKNALRNLFDALPGVIAKCSQGKYKVKDKEKIDKFFTQAFE